MRLVGKGEMTINYSQTPVNRQDFGKEDHDIFLDGKQIGIMFPMLKYDDNNTRIYTVSAELNSFEIDPDTRLVYKTSNQIELEQCDDSVFDDYTLTERNLKHSY